MRDGHDFSMGRGRVRLSEVQAQGGDDMSRHQFKIARRRKERRRHRDRIGGLMAKDAAMARERMALSKE
jgi:hypothetical protein